MTQEEIAEIQQIPLRDKNMIGSGMFGSVYKIEYKGKAYAIKKQVTHKNISEREKTILQTLSENVEASQYVPRFYGSFQVEDNTYIIMEYINGFNLDRICNTDLPNARRITVDEKSFIFSKIAEAIDAIHRAGYVMNDIKGDNIMIQINDKNKIVGIKIIDFGIAGSIGEEDPFGSSQIYKKENNLRKLGYLDIELHNCIDFGPGYGGKRKTYRQKRRKVRKQKRFKSRKH